MKLNITLDIPMEEDLAPSPGYRCGVTGIGQTDFHVECIEVKGEDEYGGWVAVNEDFQSRLDAIESEMETKLALTKLPGSDADWFIIITPFAE